MKKILKLAVLAGGAYAASKVYSQWNSRNTPAAATRATVGQDTATGTDPQAKWSEPGYQDKSLGQAVNADAELVEELVAESEGDLGAAEHRFNEESSGAPALARQRHDETTTTND